MARSRSRGDAQPKPKSDAYVVLLFIALAAQIAGAVFLYLDLSSYPEAKPPAVAAKPAPTPGTPTTP